MGRRKDINSFALKWLRIFNSRTERDDDRIALSMIDDLIDLGFDRECENLFCMQYGEAAYDYRSLRKVISEIDDIDLIGSAIVSRWKYYFDISSPSIFCIEGVRWFNLALKRLLDLSDYDSPGLIGNVKKIHLSSNAACYGLSPEPDEEIRQSLTFNSKGMVWLSGYNVDGVNLRSLFFRIDKEKSRTLISAYEEYFDDYEPVFCTDTGMFDIELTAEDGKTHTFSGSLSATGNNSAGLSDLTRDILNRKSVYAIDGNAVFDSVHKIILEYRNNMKGDSEDEEYEICYSEKIIIDRETSTLKISKGIDEECIVNTEYHIKGGIESLLDSFNVKYLFSYTEGNPDNVINDPNSERLYTFTIETEKGAVKVLEGTFDKRGLPSDYGEFIQKVYYFVRFYDGVSLFNMSAYGRNRRCSDEYIYLSVEFEQGCRTYYYVTDDDSIDEQDFVIVPAGKDNHEDVALVRKVEYFKKEEVPYPYDKTKKVIRKCTPEECEAIWEDVT